MWLYVLVFTFQVLFNVFKTMEIKYTYENKIRSLLINSVWINLVSLGSVYYSLESLFRGDYFGILFYIAGSVTGKYIAMEHYENIKGEFFKILGKDISKLNLTLPIQFSNTLINHQRNHLKN